jgi:hypothetical protein
VNYHFRSRVAEEGRVMGNRGGRAGIVNVPYIGGKLRFVEPAMIHGNVVAQPVKLCHHMRTDEVGPPNNQDPHTTSNYKASLAMSPAER